jgi:predicted O-linked N-acetylglucosamine transferase (SPINDLY family)
MQEMIREQFQHVGGNPDQLIFANTRPHWNAFAEVDLILDTFPTSSGTTVTEAAWMGVPTITLQSRPVYGKGRGMFVDLTGP